MTQLSKPDAQVAALLRKYSLVIERLYHPEAIWLFGSRAAGKAEERSDIDIIVVSRRFSEVQRLKRRSTFLRETGLAKDYELPVVDPLCYTPQEFERGLEQPTILAEAVRTGVKLLGNGGDGQEEWSG